MALRHVHKVTHLETLHIDGTFSMTKRDKVDRLLLHFNSVHSIIKVNKELKEGGSIIFIDTRVTRKAESKRDIAVFLKPTHTDRQWQI